MALGPLASVPPLRVAVACVDCVDCGAVPCAAGLLLTARVVPAHGRQDSLVAKRRREGEAWGDRCALPCRLTSRSWSVPVPGLRAHAADRYGKEPGEYLLLRMELTHVVNNLENYMMHQVHSDPPSRLQPALDAAHDLDEIAALHRKFLERLRDRFARVVVPPGLALLTSQPPPRRCRCCRVPVVRSGGAREAGLPPVALLAREIRVTHSWNGA